MTGSPMAAQYAALSGAVLEGIADALDDLGDGELHALPIEDGASIGFLAWHLARSADNIVHFVFHRERPVWGQQGLAAAWGLPRNDQGTGMPLAEAQALRFPGAAPLAQYVRDVAAACVPRIEGMDDDFLLGASTSRILGEVAERQRAATIGIAIAAHGNQHLGHIQLLRQLLGKPGSGE